jgi:RNA recognition motif-containing protein
VSGALELAEKYIYSYNVSSEELFDLFGKFGPIRYVNTPAFLRVVARWINSDPNASDKSAKASPTTPRALPSLSMKT